MASGNQIWNGICADLEKAPIRISISAQFPSGLARISAFFPSRAVNSYVPPIWPRITIPASMARPPPTVRISDLRAPYCPLSRVYQKPIRRNELIEVSSQKI